MYGTAGFPEASPLDLKCHWLQRRNLGAAIFFGLVSVSGPNIHSWPWRLMGREQPCRQLLVLGNTGGASVHAQLAFKVD